MATYTDQRTFKHRATEPVPADAPRPASSGAHRASRTPQLVIALVLLLILTAGLAVLIARQ